MLPKAAVLEVSDMNVTQNAVDFSKSSVSQWDWIQESLEHYYSSCKRTRQKLLYFCFETLSAICVAVT